MNVDIESHKKAGKQLGKGVSILGNGDFRVSVGNNKSWRIKQNLTKLLMY